MHALLVTEANEKGMRTTECAVHPRKERLQNSASKETKYCMLVSKDQRCTCNVRTYRVLFRRTNMIRVERSHDMSSFLSSLYVPRVSDMS